MSGVGVQVEHYAFTFPSKRGLWFSQAAGCLGGFVHPGEQLHWTIGIVSKHCSSCGYLLFISHRGDNTDMSPVAWYVCITGCTWAQKSVHSRTLGAFNEQPDPQISFEKGIS